MILYYFQGGGELSTKKVSVHLYRTKKKTQLRGFQEKYHFQVRMTDNVL